MGGGETHGRQVDFPGRFRDSSISKFVIWGPFADYEFSTQPTVRLTAMGYRCMYPYLKLSSTGVIRRLLKTYQISSADILVARLKRFRGVKRASIRKPPLSEKSSSGSMQRAGGLWPVSRQSMESKAPTQFLAGVPRMVSFFRR